MREDRIGYAHPIRGGAARRRLVLEPVADQPATPEVFKTRRMKDIEALTASARRPPELLLVKNTLGSGAKPRKGWRAGPASHLTALKLLGVNRNFRDIR